MKNKPFAKKSLGQNFLVDERIIERIVAALDLSAADTVIEIGPGRGALTRHLIDSGANVIAIELDRELVPMLREQFHDQKNFAILEADALEIDFSSLGFSVNSVVTGGQKPETTEHTEPNTDLRSIKLIANLPYYISTAILQRLIEQRSAFSQMVLMFQKEVVDRITARPGDSERGFLTVLVEAFLDAEKLFDVPPTAFRPVPKVHSSVVRLTPKNSPPYEGGVDAALGGRGGSLSDDEETAFRKLVSASFAQKRKTILNNLKMLIPNAADLLTSAGIDPTRRAETLTLNEWLALHAEVRT